MKIQCDVCEKIEAEVLCCADEAVLCRKCDEKVHAANKLSQKHERVLLKHPSSSSSSSSSNVQLPPRDLCQVCILQPSAGRFLYAANAVCVGDGAKGHTQKILHTQYRETANLKTKSVSGSNLKTKKLKGLKLLLGHSGSSLELGSGRF